MSETIEAAKKHFNFQGMKQIDVPEWGEEGNPLTVYCTPLTLRERKIIFSKSDNPNDPALIAWMVIEKALTADGKKMFNIGDRAALETGVDGSVVERIAKAVMGVEDIAGK